MCRKKAQSSTTDQAMGSDLLKISEVAEHLRVSERTVYRWLRDRQLTAVRIGGVTRVRRQDLEAFIERHADTRAKAS
jgi:excisionase family DNA binding protein